MVTEAHQFISGATPHDAITEFALGIQEIFQKKSLVSNIYCPVENIEPSLLKSKKILPLRRFQLRDNHALIVLHFSIASEVTHVFNSFKGKKVLFFHNVTPPKYFLEYNEEILWFLLESELELKKLIKQGGVHFYTCSTYNKTQLRAYDADPIGIVSLPVPKYLLQLKNTEGGGKKNVMPHMDLLYVGRCVPHKKIEKLILICHILWKIFKIEVRLYIAGENDSTPKYLNKLKALTERLDVSRQVHFLGRVSNAELKRLYQSAFFFLHFSEHEGFCLPIIESIYFGLPVLTDGKCAIDETLSGCGIKLNEYEPLKAALILEYFFKHSESYTHLKQAVAKRMETLKNQFSWENIERWIEKILVCEEGGENHE